MDLEPLIRRAKQGDLDAFAEVTRRFQHMAFGYALALLRDLDSFTGRGVRGTATDQSRVAAAMVVDAYRALGLLATHPAIDPKRIAVSV